MTESDNNSLSFALGFPEVSRELVFLDDDDDEYRLSQALLRLRPSPYGSASVATRLFCPILLVAGSPRVLIDVLFEVSV